MTKLRTHRRKRESMNYDDYVKERESLSKGEQTSYESYEKAILTLAASFLAFSVAFVGLFKAKTPAGADIIAIASPRLLALAWVLFAISVFLMLLNFVINAQAFRKEVLILEEALNDIRALETQKNIWTTLAYAVYISSGVSFVLGIVFLIAFSVKNLPV